MWIIGYIGYLVLFLSVYICLELLCDGDTRKWRVFFASIFWPVFLVLLVVYFCYWKFIEMRRKWKSKLSTDKQSK
jgi:succinate dehydrogenase hydrophobic anchor subunit